MNLVLERTQSRSITIVDVMTSRATHLSVEEERKLYSGKQTLKQQSINL